MGKIIKIADTSQKLKDLMNVLDEAGCISEEKMKARTIFKIYLDDKAEINK